MQSQTARGENQNRSGSAFTGAESAGGSGAPTNANASSTHYRERSDSPNDLLSPGAVDAENDPGGYGYSAAVGSAHNGAGDLY